ncbi:hypothetical protein JTB14_000934 [Gonioctena quinquepunctata]|nr:hypothetical protein JTB14_000934 [Gonioctena quinquepunctata]
MDMIIETGFSGIFYDIEFESSAIQTHFADSAIHKLFGGIIKRHLMEYLDQKESLTGRMGSEKIEAYVTSLLYRAIDNKKTCLGIFVDLAKAFDTVSHELSLKKLKHIGIRGTPLGFFRSFLKDKQQMVEIDVVSSQKTVSCDFPQGT